MNKISLKVNILLASWHFILVMIGYVFFTSIFSSYMAQESTQIVTVPYRAAVLALEIFIIAKNIRVRFNKYALLLVLFCFVYAIRVVYDNHFTLVSPVFNKNYASQAEICTLLIIIPSVCATVASFKYINWDYALKWMFYIGLISAVVSLNFSSFTNAVGDDLERVDGNLALKTISFGQFGATLIILSTCVYVRELLPKVMPIIAIILGGYIVLISGSRGPIFAILICFSMWWLIRRRFRVTRITIFFSIALFIYLCSTHVLYLISMVSPSMEIRLLEAIAGNSTGRDTLYLLAWDTFLNYPFLGYAYVLPRLHFYPHNLILELLSALGVVGILLFLPLIATCLRRVVCIFNEIKSDKLVVALLFVQFFSAQLTSGTIWTAGQMFVLIALLLSMKQSTYLEHNKNLRRTGEYGQ